MLSHDERMLAEAVDTMLRHEPELGLSFHKDKEEGSHFTQFKHEQILEMFELKTIDLIHHDAIVSAFNKVHSYKYIDDPKFIEAFEKELTWHGVPKYEIKDAIKAVNDVMADLAKDENIDPEEFKLQDAGWNPKLDEIKEVSQPPQPPTK